MIETKQIYENLYKPDGLNYGGVQENFLQNLPQTNQHVVLKRWLKVLDVGANENVIEVGCGFARHCQSHPNWVGYEFSSEAKKLRSNSSTSNLLKLMHESYQ